MKRRRRFADEVRERIVVRPIDVFEVQLKADIATRTNQAAIACCRA